MYALPTGTYLQGTKRMQAKAYPVDDPILNKEAYESTKKDFTDAHCVALELKNTQGIIRNKLGESIDVKF